MDHYERSSRNAFAANPLDRLQERRRDPAWVADALAQADTRFVPVWRSRSLLSYGPEPQPVFVGPEGLGLSPGELEALVLLGERDGSACFAVGLPARDDSVPDRCRSLGEFRDLRTVASTLTAADGALLAYARAMVHWHRHHAFCGCCGSPTVSRDAGHLRVCAKEGCGKEHFPRTDPAIIVLVTFGDRCLLGRQSQWPENMYSTLAGFVEPGESLEDAVVREVREEADVTVVRAWYQSSQPWPFPASLMVGYVAEAADVGIHLRDGELEDARWFTREGLEEAALGGRVRLPSPHSIAYRLIEGWFDQDGRSLLKCVRS